MLPTRKILVYTKRDLAKLHHAVMAWHGLVTLGFDISWLRLIVFLMSIFFYWAKRQNLASNNEAPLDVNKSLDGWPRWKMPRIASQNIFWGDILIPKRLSSETSVTTLCWWSLFSDDKILELALSEALRKIFDEFITLFSATKDQEWPLTR